MPVKSNGDIDWSKVFMGFAVAVVFIMQQWHSMQMADIKAEVVPRSEYSQAVIHKDVVLEAVNRLGQRLDALEGKPNEHK